MTLDYVVADPVGNITVLVNTVPEPANRADIIRKAFELEPRCEQVGFVSRESSHCVDLEMMGYEFCGNATLSAACYQAYLNDLEVGWSDRFKVNSSGVDEAVDVVLTRIGDKRSFPAYQATLRVSPPTADTFEKYPVMHLDGISHMLVPAGEMSDEAATSRIRDIADHFKVPALGIILYDRLAEDRVAIRPLVYVVGSDTLVWENGCASGSTATAYYLHTQTGADSIEIIQAGGEIIRLDINDSSLYLTANVIIEK